MNILLLAEWWLLISLFVEDIWGYVKLLMIAAEFANMVDFERDVIILKTLCMVEISSWWLGLYCDDALHMTRQLKSLDFLCSHFVWRNWYGVLGFVWLLVDWLSPVNNDGDKIDIAQGLNNEIV